MSHWNSFFSCGRNRWLCSAVCTVSLILCVLALPVWDFHLSSEVRESFSENEISVVTVTQKHRVKSIEKKAAKKTIPEPETVPVIPREKEEPDFSKTEEAEEKSEEAADEGETNEESAEAEASDSSAESAELGSERTVSEQEAKAMASYKSYALSRIASKKTYPYSARSKGIEGKVRVRVVIQTDGTVSDCEILQPCEHEILNEACLSAIKKSAPFKKMKQGMGAMTLVFVMDFSLK